MSKIALEHGATIDKYIGDAIVAFFGDPESRGVKEDALACVNMAIAMQRRLRELQSDWRDSGMERPFQLRIGVNTGYCTVGNFGSEDRMDYTIIGSPVNLAARLQSYGEPGSIQSVTKPIRWSRKTIRAEEQASIQVKKLSQADPQLQGRSAIRRFVGPDTGHARGTSWAQNFHRPPEAGQSPCSCGFKSMLSRLES